MAVIETVTFTNNEVAEVSLNGFVTDGGFTFVAASPFRVATSDVVNKSSNGSAYEFAFIDDLAPGTANYSVKADINLLNTNDFTAVGVMGRVSGASGDSGYSASVDPNQKTLFIEEISAGVRTKISGDYDLTAAIGTPPTTLPGVEIYCDGDQISAWLNGSEVIAPVTDTTHTAAGKAGFYMRVGTNFGDIELDDLVINTLGPSLSIDQANLTPGGAISGSYGGYETVPTTLTVSDGTNTITIASPTISDNGDGTGTFSGTMPSLPTSGTANLILFGNVTVELS